MNSRRLIGRPQGQNHAPHRLTAVRVLERGKGDANCDQLFWAGNVSSGSHDRSNGKAQNRKCFPLCPRKRLCAVKQNNINRLGHTNRCSLGGWVTTWVSFFTPSSSFFVCLALRRARGNGRTRLRVGFVAASDIPAQKHQAMLREYKRSGPN